jgi:hypothetical protein
MFGILSSSWRGLIVASGCVLAVFAASACSGGDSGDSSTDVDSSTPADGGEGSDTSKPTPGKPGSGKPTPGPVQPEPVEPDPVEPKPTHSTGIGEPCEDDGDCADGLACRDDETDYIAHKQCTQVCTDSDSCDPEGTGDAFCIGAEICVRSCKADADACPKGTACNSNDWCERAGAGAPKCAGTPLPCSLQGASGCDAMGCTSSGQCRGVASSCYLQWGSYSCSMQDGCYWSSYSDDCSGFARSCSGFASSYGCNNQDGCNWEDTCTGTPLSCELFSVAECALQPGCYVVTP